MLPTFTAKGIQEAMSESRQTGPRGTLVVSSVGNTVHAYRVSYCIWLLGSAIPLAGSVGWFRLFRFRIVSVALDVVTVQD